MLSAVLCIYSLNYALIKDQGTCDITVVLIILFEVFVCHKLIRCA